MLIRSRSQETSEQRAVYHSEVEKVGEFTVVTDKGGRSENQDAWSVCQTKSGGYFFIVADGLGGHRGGRIAAQAAVEGVEKYAQEIEESITSPHIVTEAFRRAQENIKAQQQALPDLESMRSTLVMLAVQDGHAIWGHIGDVRLYFFTESEVTFQTKDQSVPQLMVDTGEIEPEDIRNHPDRSRLLQALGKPDDQYKLKVSNEVVQLSSNHQFLLCTDGFWEWILESQMSLALTKDTIQDTMDFLEQKLQENASKEEDDFDNYTFMLLNCSNLVTQGSKWSATRLVPSFLKGKSGRSR